MSNRVAILIPDCDMPEYREALRSHIHETVRHPHDLIIVNNSSELNWACDPEMICLPKGIEMTHAVLIGLAYADALARLGGFEYFAYWIVTTSMKFAENDPRDVLAELVSLMQSDPQIVMASPAIAGNIAWKCMYRMESGPRKVWGVDNIAVLLRADWFNSIGRYDPALTIGWGPSLESCWLARKAGKKIMVHDGLLMEKHTGIAHRMERRPETLLERNERASEEMDRVLSAKYGTDYMKKLMLEYRTLDMTWNN